MSYILVIHVIKGQEHDILSWQNKIFIFGYKNLNCRRLTQQFTHASLTSYVLTMFICLSEIIIIHIDVLLLNQDHT